MNPVQDLFDAMSTGIPRVSGGEPDSGAVEAGKKLYSPRERG